MLTPDYLEHCADEAVRINTELENFIIKDIARRIVRSKVMTETARHQIRAVQESGYLYNDIIEEIVNITKLSKSTVKEIFENAAIETMTFDDKIYELAGLKPTAFRESPKIMQILKAGIQKANGDIHNLTMTSAGIAQSKFIETTNMAYRQYTSGAFDYNTAIFNAVEQLSKDGINVQYPSGKLDKIDVAVRRAVLTGVNQTANKLQDQRAEEMGTDLVEVTAHIGARVTKKQDWTNHAWWQGKVYSISGNSDKYPSLKETTGYGKIDGLGGINCRHNKFPFIEGISKRAYTDKELEEINDKTVTYNGKEYKEYEALKTQRTKEREIRKVKRELSGYQGIMLGTNDEKLLNITKNKFNLTSNILKQKEKELQDFIEQTGLKRNNERERVVGFDKSLSQKAIKANKNSTEVQNNDILAIPELIYNTVNKQNQKICKKAENFINSNVKKQDLLEKYDTKIPFYYSKKDDKIIINSQHRDIQYYQIDEAISHEVVHMKDIREKITENNYESLIKRVNEAKMYVDNNYSYFYRLLNDNKENMAISDILSAITKGKLQGDFGRNDINYWKNEYVVISEISANIISSDLIDNKIVDKLLEEIPPLKEMKKELLKLYGLEIK